MNRDIEKLLEKYWMCETTLEEEQELHRFFAEEEVPEKLQSYAELFLLQTEEKEESLDDSFDERILELIAEEEAPVRRRRILHPVWQIAASVVILLMLWFAIDMQLSKSDPWSRETYETPEQALAEINKVLSTVSGHIEKGQAMVDKNLEKIDPVTQILK